MSRPTYTIGLLGASRIARKAIIAPASRREDCRITALACRDVERGRAYAREHGLGEIDVIDSYAEMGARADVDIIYNALPPALHLQTARACMGKVQLIEKPFAMSADEAREMASLPGVVMEAMHHRYHPAMAIFLRQLDRIRPLTHMVGRFHAAIPFAPGQLRYVPELGGGGFNDLGIYPLSVARWAAGREPAVTRAEAVWHETGVDTRMVAQLDFGDGLTAEVSSDMCAGVTREIWFEATGAGGTIRFDNMVHPHLGGTIRGPDGEMTEPRWAEVATYDAQLGHLIACLRMGGAPLTGGAEAVAQQAAVDAVYAAARSRSVKP